MGRDLKACKHYTVNDKDIVFENFYAKWHPRPSSSERIYDKKVPQIFITFLVKTSQSELMDAWFTHTQTRSGMRQNGIEGSDSDEM